MGKFCIFPKILPFFNMGKKLAILRKNAKKSHDFPSVNVVENFLTVPTILRQPERPAQNYPG